MNTSRALAVTRAVLGVAVVLNALEVAAIMVRIDEGRLAMPWLLGDLPIDVSAIMWWFVANLAVGLLLACGAFTRGACATAVALNVFAIAWDQQVYSNHLWLTCLLLTLLAFSGAGSAGSRRTPARRSCRQPSRLVMLLMVTQLSVCYVFGALSKLNPWWLDGRELRSTMWVELPTTLYAPLAVLVIATELFIGLGMWFRLTRPVALAFGGLLHLSIVVLMTATLPLLTFSLVCLGTYPLVCVAPALPTLVVELRGSAAARRDIEPLPTAPAPH